MAKAKRKAKRSNPKRRKAHAKRSNPKRRRKAHATAKRSNPKRRRHHAKRANPRRRHARRRNPGMSDVAMRAGKAVVGGVVAAGAAYGTVRLMQKFPAKSKGGAIAGQVAAAVVGGAALGAISPIAGGLYAATMGSAIIATAQAPSASATAGAAKTTQGLIDKKVQGLLPSGTDKTDDYDVAMRGRMNGLISQKLRAAR